MESITKNRQPAATLRAMIARAYGEAQVPEHDGFATELGYGWFNVAYRVSLCDGSEAVLKIAPPADVQVMTYELDMMRNELAALDLVRRATDVPVPRVDHADTSRELCDADWFAMPFVEGDTLAIVEARMPLAERAAYQEAVGAITRDLNAVIGPHFGPLEGQGESTWRATFTRMLDEVLEDGRRRDVDLGWGYGELRSLAEAHADALDDVREPRFVEWDLWPGNVMIRNGRVVAIIDHERAFYGDPLVEAGFAATVLPGFGDASAFLRGYGRGPLTESELTRRRLYCLHLLLVMIVETEYRGHRDRGQYEWARGQLDELVAQFGQQPPAVSGALHLSS